MAKGGRYSSVVNVVDPILIYDTLLRKTCYLFLSAISAEKYIEI